MKTCSVCKLELPVEYFSKNKAKPDGYHSTCKECHKVYRREHYNKNRDYYIKRSRKLTLSFNLWWKEYKQKLKCSFCSENDPACLQFHHVDDSKENTVSFIAASGNRKKLLEEINKCIVLCANCHFKLHAAEFDTIEELKQKIKELTDELEKLKPIKKKQ